MYSGGIDSELILQVFKKLKIKTNIVFIRLEPNYNNYDYYFVQEFVKNYDVKIQYITINFDKFVESGKFAEIANNINCHVHQYPALFHGALQLDGIVLIGGNEPHFALDETWVIDEYESQSCLNRFYSTYCVNGTPAFLNYTSETLLSFMNEKTIIDLINNKYKLTIKGSNILKYNFYKNYIPIRNRKKKDGYEAIRESKIFNHPDIQVLKSKRINYIQDGNGRWSMGVQFIRHILEKNLDLVDKNK